MMTKHLHRPSFRAFLCPSFRAFLSGRTARIKGRRVTLYQCKECGATIRIVPSQQGFHDFLPALPCIILWFAGMILLGLGVRIPKNAPVIAGAFLLTLLIAYLVYLIVYAIAYRFTRYKVFSDGEEKSPRE